MLDLAILFTNSNNSQPYNHRLTWAAPRSTKPSFYLHICLTERRYARSSFSPFTIFSYQLNRAPPCSTKLFPFIPCLTERFYARTSSSLLSLSYLLNRAFLRSIKLVLPKSISYCQFTCAFLCSTHISLNLCTLLRSLKHHLSHPD